VVVADRRLRAVDGEHLVVGADAVAVGIGVGEDAALKHLVGGEADAGDDVGGAEAGLLDLGEVVLGVAVEFEDADVDERVVLVRPDLGEIEGVPTVGFGVFLGHDLDAETPLREIAALDGSEEIALGGLAVLGDDGGGLGVGVEFDSLEGLEVELHPEAFAGGVEEAVGVAAIAVDVAEVGRQAAVGHEDGDLVEALGAE
jgi:hypothetical protein